MKELLDSDRVNFLIWRYLLEGNYRETAAKFQKEWRVEAPHRHFDFAPYVSNYALISVLNKGLIYQGLERDYAQSRVPSDAAATADQPQSGVFGPLVAQPPVNYDELEDEDEEPLPEPEPAADEVEKSSLKRQVDPQSQLANGNAAKRPRLGNADGLENGAETATSPMEIDQHQSDNHAYPSPLEGEQAPTPAPRTEGPDHGTQTEKVDELEAKTFYLRLANDDSSSVAETPTAEVSHSRANQNPILLHCEWNPKDPSRLAAAGTDTLARVWTVSRATGPELVADHVDPGWPSMSLVTDDFPPDTKVTAIAWASDGSEIAVATDSGQKARIDLWNLEGRQLRDYDGLEGPIVKLRYNPWNRHFLSISPLPNPNPTGDPRGWAVTVFTSPSSSPVTYEYTDHEFYSQQADATWMSEAEFVLCVGTKLLSLKYTGDSILHAKEFETRPDDPLTEVQHDGRHDSGWIAAASAKGYIDIWDPSGERRSRPAPAHDGQITALQWQPLQSHKPEDERLLASGGEDGTIAIWDARVPEIKQKFEMTIDLNPVLALAFTPDGAFIAGATRDRVLIWKVGDYSLPRAQWRRAAQPGGLSPKLNGETDLEDQHCLCWDANGQKLAFGVNGLLAVMNFR